MSGAQTPEAEPADVLRRRLFAAGIMVAVLALSIFLALNPDLIQRFGSWGYAGAFLISLLASASLVLPLPGLAIAIALGTTLNPVVLGAVSGVGSAVGELSGYALGRGGRVLLSSDQQRHYDRLERWTRKWGALAIFLVAIFPLPLFDVAGIVAGAIRMPIWVFLLATALGKTIKYTLAILVGAGWVSGLAEWLNTTQIQP